MTNNALVGFSGFVGSFLNRSTTFQHLYRSHNFEEAKGKQFDELVFSGARAEKWKANLEPESDRAHIEQLIHVLKDITANRALLISTADVYPAPRLESERWIDASEANHAYGKNRAFLEREFVAHFPESIVIRLPALFGIGLKKNAVYDLLNNNQVEKVDSRGSFQFYDLEWLAADIDRAWKIHETSGEKLFNFATEPVSIAEVAKALTGADFKNHVAAHPAHYDLRSKWDADWQAVHGYLYPKEKVLEALAKFATVYRSAGRS